ncbi:arylsulfotransferase family protein [Nocardia cyriacigeorgica]|uniref:arylsulfotransferase family protein n=1 Tax=Nocardia cyriacigeorgica TaxID=135487 RepID=UPI0024565431|nr:arylsulfotransferase family protein [Nocardia cyriacigeorgica]
MDTAATHFLFSPSSTYPRPIACLIDRDAQVVHAWSSDLDQPAPQTRPPGYLRGWNHVELGADGSLYATVPLHSLLKLAPDSTPIWRVELPVHHDLHVTDTGQVYALTEQPRLIDAADAEFVLLDNSITVIDATGAPTATYSLFDLLTSDAVLSALITSHIDRRRRSPHHHAALATFHDLAAAGALRPGRAASRLLRDLPDSPADLLHANTVEVVHAHPAGLWGDGDVLVSMRELDTIAVLDLAAGAVRWWWGPGELSGQHQPTMLPNGNLLVFDNGQHHGYSRVLEIDPARHAIIWQHLADPPQNLFCPLAGGAEPLPDGNIVISDAQGGRALEVNRNGDTVWTVATLTTTGDRAQFYRMAAIDGALAVAVIGPTEYPATGTARELLRCELLDPVRSPR